MDIAIDFHGVAVNPEEITIRRAKERFGVILKPEDCTTRRAVKHLPHYGEVVKAIEEGLDIFEYKVAPYVPEAFAHLKRSGHGLFIVSSIDERKSMKKGMQLLADHDVIYDDWIPTADTPKHIVCQSLGIDLLVDDDPFTVLDSLENGLDALLYDRPCNRDIEVPQGKRMYSFRGVVEYVEGKKKKRCRGW